MATGGGGGPGAADAAGRAGGGRGEALPRGDRRAGQRGGGATRSGPYTLSRAPAALQRQRELARAALRRHGLLGAPGRPPPKPAAKRSVKFHKGYVALSQTADESLVSLDSDRPSLLWLLKELAALALTPSFHPSDGELESRGSSGYSSAEVNQDLSRQLLQDGYHLDEVPDDEDLDLIPPKPTTSSCPCCFGDSLSCVVQ
ncbi:protein FAM219B isoform X2 [Gallus gallus]|uniref:protein FAM219B isoform X2 n=1 Tax=Gallus gallus TaxID=9031 RepID=UPI001AE80036|nr:protein FAM219B isoform X2 [Gallus gallus]XP_040562542.1 protein FAM219B isoform X2 [Gallus gallus]